MGFDKAPTLGKGTILLQARYSDSRIKIDPGTITSNNISIIACSNIEIVKNCQIGDHLAIYDSDFHAIYPGSRNASDGKISPVLIGENVWLGSRVIVLKGVPIGDDSVVAAGSVVTKTIPPRCIAAGVLAKIIRRI